MLKPIRGTKDVFGQNLEKYKYIFEVASKLANNFSYQEILLPTFENSEVFLRTLGQSSDILHKETYTFIDREKRSITLRPEFTASIIRSLISNGLHQNLPQRFFTYGSVFRHERPQQCRYREFMQFNCELIGINNPLAEIEVISLSYLILEKLNLASNITLQINTLGDLNSRKEYLPNLINKLNEYRKDLSADSQRRIDLNPLRIFDSKEEQDKEIIKKLPKLEDYLSSSAKKHYETVCHHLNLLQIPYIHNPLLVRGLDYYDHVVFEFTSTHIGSQGTVLAGGRYNKLASQLSDYDIPAIGFAIGVERAAFLIEEINKVQKMFYLICMGDVLELASQICYRLRKLGLIVRYDINLSFKKSMKVANTIKASHCLLIMEEEMKRGYIIIKDMQTGIQQEVEINKLENVISTY